MINPVSTYRIQFHQNFTFPDFERIIPYLDKLGVRTVYASPIFEATPGSDHGYDSVNPQRINPEIGTEAQLIAISEELTRRGMKWVQDIVPNHMAFHPNNSWLMDVLEKGQLSSYASFFDIDWTSPVHAGRLMVPFLGSSLDETLEKGELSVAFETGKLVLAYYDTAYPIHLRSYATILRAVTGGPDKLVKPLLDDVDEALAITESDEYSTRSARIQSRLAELEKDTTFRSFLNKSLKAISSTPGTMQQIADEQAYRLCYHAETDRQINYRRFFTVNGLICLNIQDPAVFDEVHKLPKALIEAGVLHGLRIDHIDGLSDPTRYLERLREMAGEEVYIAVEKILQNDEELPAYWPVQGTTGYAYLSMVNNLFTRTGSETSFTRFYYQLLGEEMAIRQELYDKKAYILTEHMNGELDNLYARFESLHLLDRHTVDEVSPELLRSAMAEFLIQCPVYRYYGNQMPLSEIESEAVRGIFDRIRTKKPELKPAVDQLEIVFLEKPREGKTDYNDRVLRFYQRCMQFTGPLTAKGVEDTLMYTYNRFIGHDEVGDSPEYFGLTVDAFHQKMADRQRQWPLALNATSTHDTKRGEDVRSRLNVLTDLTDEWIRTVQSWQEITQSLKLEIEDDSLSDGLAPDANDEYFIYQTLVGAYPMPDQDEDDFPNRLTEYLQKAMREGKRNTNYSEPNQAYEDATKAYALKLLDRKKPFWKSFQAFHRRIADFGIVNSLAQVVLKCTCPGVPDVYQGCEGWDFSLVDPDNRRPVDYGLRQRSLDDLENRKGEMLWPELWENRYDARIKQWLVHTLLKERNEEPDLFANGHYIPLEVEGRYKENVLAFARRYERCWYVIAVPLGIAQLSNNQEANVLALDWQTTRIMLPPEAPKNWKHRLSSANGKADKSISVGELFNDLPLAVLRLEFAPTERSAGILLPVTSLPSAYGIGDFGPEATAFADFLSRSRQTYWQVLPLNPVDSGEGHSPYSANSSLAGSPLFISPDILVREGLLDEADLAGQLLPQTDHVDFKAASRLKQALLDKAWQRFEEAGTAADRRAFGLYCQQEATWLDDYALYAVLKEAHSNEPWHRWPEAFRLRKPDALVKFREEQAESIDKAKWFQFLFARQWDTLKTYCNSLGVRLFGDLPFYISHDSVDVWANPNLFSLDKEGKMTAIAGVPPDYFNADGQIWGMPVFRWDELKKQDYAWWIERLRKNMERYDLLRLDHFRAFSDYWEVPAGEKTAIKGVWNPGPGADFFKVVKRELGELPFVAEDLGKINRGVYELRDEFDLPGMNVLQFAFGEEMPQSVNSLHHHRLNSVAYTGTHDNNTTRGWYRKDAQEEQREQLNKYTGQTVSEENVHTVLGRMTYASVAKIAILPMQDVLGLDESARLNTPASASNNWSWRVMPNQLTTAIEEQLREWTNLYDR